MEWKPIEDDCNCFELVSVYIPELDDDEEWREAQVGYGWFSPKAYGGDDKWTWHTQDYDSNSDSRQPTHWMPLPPSPAQEKSE